MKLQLLCSMFLLGGSLAHAQESFKVVKPEVELNTTASEEALEILNAGLINLTNTPDTIYFRLVSVQSPDDWMFSLCGSEQCYVPGPSSLKGKDLLKVSDKPQLFEVNWSARSEGTGELVYEVYSYQAPTDVKVVTFRMAASPLSTVSPIVNFTAVYPNPCKDVLNIATPDNSYSEVSLTDLSGRLVMTQPISSLNTILNTSTL